ncbi:MAG: ankyrin repeat domain-containing protein [Patescibacteria group bacterium]
MTNSTDKTNGSADGQESGHLHKHEKATRYALLELCAWGISRDSLKHLADYCSTRQYPLRLDFNAYSVKEHPTTDLKALTPLTAACGLMLTSNFAKRSEEDERLEIVKELLQLNADPNFQPTDDFWTSPLMIASWIGYEKITELLLRHKANVNFTDRNNSTALIFAASKGHAKIVQQLLDDNADAEIINANGMSAIHCAVARAHIPVIRILMKNQGITPDELRLIEKSVFRTANVKTGSPTITQNTYPLPG